MSRIQRVGTQMLLLLCATAAWPQLGTGQGTHPLSVNEARKKLGLARISWSAAQSHQKAGEFTLAIAEYSQAIETLSAFTADPESKAVLADAHFGRASSLQQDTRSDSAAISPAVARDSTALSDYGESSTLDSARFFSAANNNAGMLLHDAGKHREALARFLAATRSPHPARGAFFVHAADEYLELNLPDSAAQAYRAALSNDSTLVAARAGRPIHCCASRRSGVRTRCMRSRSWMPCTRRSSTVAGIEAVRSHHRWPTAASSCWHSTSLRWDSALPTSHASI